MDNRLQNHLYQCLYHGYSAFGDFLQCCISQSGRQHRINPQLIQQQIDLLRRPDAVQRRGHCRRDHVFRLGKAATHRHRSVRLTVSLQQSTQINLTEINFAQIKTAQIQAADLNPAEIDLTEVDSTEINTAQIRISLLCMDLFNELCQFAFHGFHQHGPHRVADQRRYQAGHQRCPQYGHHQNHQPCHTSQQPLTGTHNNKPHQQCRNADVYYNSLRNLFLPPVRKPFVNVYAFFCISIL